MQLSDWLQKWLPSRYGGVPKQRPVKPGLLSSLATHLFSAGAPIAVVSKLLGHAKVGMTPRYLALRDADRRDAVGRFADRRVWCGDGPGGVGMVRDSRLGILVRGFAYEPIAKCRGERAERGHTGPVGPLGPPGRRGELGPRGIPGASLEGEDSRAVGRNLASF
jgi:hypothetical protein